MKLTKAFGLAAIAAVAAMAFIGTSSAAAAGEVVACKTLVTVCPSGSQWPSGTELLALSGDAVLTGVLNLQCEDAVVRGKTSAKSGSPLPFTLTEVVFGKLPTPTLGQGCTGCPGSPEVHLNTLFNGNVSVAAVDKYSLTAGGKATILCSGFTCGFINEKITSPITHTGEHAAHPNTKVLPKVEVNTILTRNLGLAFFCGETAAWKGNYVIHLAHATGFASGLAWPALN